tara:strand:- start:250 stop:510 length:261 start_codon:yes stop_codon:yes gene_type:complete
MKNIIIYSSNNCGYCELAKSLLDSLNYQYLEINIQEMPDKRDEMLRKSNGRRTVPQIFISDLHVGGYEELNRLHLKGELTELINEK